MARGAGWGRPAVQLKANASLSELLRLPAPLQASRGLIQPMTPEVASGSSRWRLSLRRSASCKAEGGSSEAESCAQLAELLRADDAGLVEGLVATGEIEGGAEAQLHTTIGKRAGCVLLGAA